MTIPSAATLSAALRAAFIARPTSGAVDNAGLTAFCDAIAAGLYADLPGETDEGGKTITRVNRTGAPSVKGSVVATSSAHDYSFMLQADEYSACGIVYDDGIADGSLCRIVVSGAADVLLEDGTAATHGQWLGCAATDGRAVASAVPAPPATDSHFKEVGHVEQSAGAGVDVLCRAIVHFN